MFHFSGKARKMKHLSSLLTRSKRVQISRYKNKITTSRYLVV
ncbi:MAG: hypothetical protein U5L45_06880 [Saprospiraceae bacterium]|nr:hypothetical protein [Saprospiraceae bacterium]